MILLDTTVLVYAVGAEHPLREPCRRIIAAVTDGHLAGTTTVEVVQEFTHVRARRLGRAEAASQAIAYATLLAPLVRPDRDDLLRGLDLFERSPSLGAFDAVLAATAIGAPHVHALVSVDRAFAAVVGLDHIDPGDADATVRLGLDR